MTSTVVVFEDRGDVVFSERTDAVPAVGEIVHLGNQDYEVVKVHRFTKPEADRGLLAQAAKFVQKWRSSNKQVAESEIDPSSSVEEHAPAKRVFVAHLAFAK